VGLSVAIVGVEGVEGVRELWLALHRHHREVAAIQPLVADDEVSWDRRRATYVEQLRAGRALLLVASEDGQAVPIGYAFVLLHPGPDDTFTFGDQYAELYTLAVAPDARNQGAGTALMDAVDAELDRRGIEDLQVAVMAGNDRALRFYERRGLVQGEVVLYRFGRPA
jgi:ribosomal protein S18 acetylase RimI-like enzyme